MFFVVNATRWIVRTKPYIYAANVVEAETNLASFGYYREALVKHLLREHLGHMPLTLTVCGQMHRRRVGTYKSCAGEGHRHEGYR